LFFFYHQILSDIADLQKHIAPEELPPIYGGTSPEVSYGEEEGDYYYYYYYYYLILLLLLLLEPLLWIEC